MEESLLEILCCPVTHQSLRFADAACLARVNEEIAAGKVKNVAGAVVTETLPEALVREDGKMLYGIREGIPVLLPEEGISI